MLGLLLALLPGNPPVSEEDAPPAFHLVERAAERGLTAVLHCGAPGPKRYLLETVGNGCALVDVDADGDLDIFLAEAGTLAFDADGAGRPAGDGRCRLYANDGRGFFTDVTEAWEVSLDDFAVGVVAADYDSDGDQDLYVTCYGPNRLLRNDSVRFTEVAAAAGVDDPHWSIAATWLDANGDGALDLYVSNYFAMDRARDPDCWRKQDCPWHDLTVACGPKGMVAEPDGFFLGNGDGTFRDAAEAWGVRSVEARYGMGVVALDAEGDGDLDVYVANDSRGNYLWINEGGQGFVQMADLLGVALNRDGTAQAGMGVACGDFDEDGDPDLFLTNFSHDLNTLYRNDDGEFLDVTPRLGLRQNAYFELGWATQFVDLDNDGGLELFVANGHIYPEADRRAPELTYQQLNRLYRRRDAGLVDVTAAAGPGMQRRRSSRGAAVGDVDNDGDLDLVICEMNATPSLLLNERRSAGSDSVLVSLEGRTGHRDAVGARLVAVVAGRSLVRVAHRGQSFASSSDPRLHLGTGGTQVSSLEVIWPGGGKQKFGSLAPGGWYHLVEGATQPVVRARWGKARQAE